MAPRIRLRHSLLTRMLTASLVIALLSVGSTAWLVSRSTTLSIAQERGQSLADDTRIQDALTGFAARNRDWSTVGPIVQDLGERTGRVITLTAPDRTVIASSGRGRPSLAERAAAVIDRCTRAASRSRRVRARPSTRGWWARSPCRSGSRTSCGVWPWSTPTV